MPALLAAHDSHHHVHLVIGNNPIASARCARSVQAGARVKLIAPADVELYSRLTQRVDDGEVEWVKSTFEPAMLTSLGREEVERVVDMVFVTLPPRESKSKEISTLCRRLRIPVNVADAPSLCTFTLLSTYTDGPLQVGVTTSGKGCKLSSRIMREISASLPSSLGQAVERLGHMRRQIWEEDHAAGLSTDAAAVVNDDDDIGQDHTFNKLIRPEDVEAAKSRRMRWLSQICEYWPLQRLASITNEDVDAILQNYTSLHSNGSDLTAVEARIRPGRIVLAGSGPGNPDLLTRASYKAILSADLVLADKLVPAPVMELVPRRAQVHIARKFPGNADKAQEELLELGLKGLREGKNVVRIKQGDPYIYGRGAEEYEFFSKHGFKPVVLPGITSALSAPLFACIPPTHRGVTDEVLICTGTGRNGAPPIPPEYVASRTVVFLMALHRLSALVSSLVDASGGWPIDTPCAVIERASCPDQRVIRTTLQYVCAAVEDEGSRPPGLLVVSRACQVLWQGQQKWAVEDGFRGLDLDKLETLHGCGAALPTLE